MSRTAHTFRTILVGILIFGAVVGCALQMTARMANLLVNPPELRSKNGVLSLTLHAALTKDDKNAFFFNGQPVPPTLRVRPGDQLRITYINDLPVHPTESCAITPCMDMTNLHFHGLAVSPDAPQDDVLTMMAQPGEVLRYAVQIPKDHAPGLYWYHTHPHGESYRQVLDGMSGALVIEGIEAYTPQAVGLPERVMIVRGRAIGSDAASRDSKRRVELGSYVCGGKAEEPSEVFTVNGALRPKIEMAPGERQFWRIVNASADRYLDLEFEGAKFDILAMDGMPLAVHGPVDAKQVTGHVLLPPAGRVEAIVQGQANGKPARLVSRCVDTGPDGDPNPEMVLADIVPGRTGALQTLSAPAVKPRVELLNVLAEEKNPPQFVATFTEDQNGFYINGKKFEPDAAPMLRVKVGTLQHWKIVNATKELHPMHIHQVHFLAYAQNGQDIPNPVWLDTVNVPYGGTSDVIVDFRDPVIRGMSVFHCHLLNHEDKGMMAKVLFE